MKQVTTHMTLEERLRLLEEAKYEGPVRPRNPRQKVTDEDLLALFKAVKGKWLRASDLQEAFQDLIRVNIANPKRSPVNYAILRRLRILTGRKWRQKTATDPKGDRLVKFYVIR